MSAAPTSNLLTTGAVAEALGVSRQQVQRWVKAGLRPAQIQRSGGASGQAVTTWMFRLDEVKAWRTANVGGHGHGGHRVRVKRAGGRGPRAEAQSHKQPAKAPLPDGPSLGPPPSNLGPLDVPLDPPTVQAGVSPLTQAKIEFERIKIQKAELEMARRRGELVPLSEVAAYIAQVVRSTARPTLEGLPARVVQDILRATAAPPDRHAAVVDILTRAVGAVMDELASIGRPDAVLAGVEAQRAEKA